MKKHKLRKAIKSIRYTSLYQAKLQQDKTENEKKYYETREKLKKELEIMDKIDPSYRELDYVQYYLGNYGEPEFEISKSFKHHSILYKFLKKK